MRNPMPLIQQLSTAEVRALVSSLGEMRSQYAAEELLRREDEHLGLRGFASEMEIAEDEKNDAKQKAESLQEQLDDANERIAELEQELESAKK